MTALTTATSTPLVVSFADGDGTMAEILGGKGAGLAQMTRLGLPVPAGFTVTTAACREYLREGHEPAALAGELAAALARLEQTAGRTLGDPVDPLLVSVRSGARFSMPGMMETILDVGLTDEVVGDRGRPPGRALRLGLLPAPRADVRADGPRGRRRRCSRSGSPGPAQTRGRRPTRSSRRASCRR